MLGFIINFNHEVYADKAKYLDAIMQSLRESSSKKDPSFYSLGDSNSIKETINKCADIIVSFNKRQREMAMSGELALTTENPLTIVFGRVAGEKKTVPFTKYSRVILVTGIAYVNLSCEFLRSNDSSSNSLVWREIKNPKYRITNGTILCDASFILDGELVEFSSGQVSYGGSTNTLSFSNGTKCKIGKRIYAYKNEEWEKINPQQEH